MPLTDRTSSKENAGSDPGGNVALPGRWYRRAVPAGGLVVGLVLFVVGPSAQASAATGDPSYYVAIGRSGSVGMQPTAADLHGQPTDSGYANDLLSTERSVAAIDGADLTRAKPFRQLYGLMATARRQRCRVVLTLHQAEHVPRALPVSHHPHPVLLVSATAPPPTMAAHPG